MATRKNCGVCGGQAQPSHLDCNVLMGAILAHNHPRQNLHSETGRQPHHKHCLKIPYMHAHQKKPQNVKLKTSGLMDPPDECGAGECHAAALQALTALLPQTAAGRPAPGQSLCRAAAACGACATHPPAAPAGSPQPAQHPPPLVWTHQHEPAHTPLHHHLIQSQIVTSA